MSNEQSIRATDASTAVDELFRHFGVWATLRAMLVVAWKRHQTRAQVTHLSDHMRRDIGLPVIKERQAPPLIPPWFPRF